MCLQEPYIAGIAIADKAWDISKLVVAQITHIKIFIAVVYKFK